MKFKGWAGSLCTRSDIIAGRSRANLSAQSALRKPHNTYQNMYITTQTKIGEEKEVTLFPPQIHLVEGLQTQTFNLFVIKPDIYQRQSFRDDRCLENRQILILNIAVLMRTRFYCALKLSFIYLRYFDNLSDVYLLFIIINSDSFYNRFVFIRFFFLIIWQRIWQVQPLKPQCANTEMSKQDK